MTSIILHKADKWVEKILAYPGINKDDLIQKKGYWLASVACLLVIVALVIGFWIYHPEFKILLSYGLFQIFMYLVFLIANIVIPGNLRKMMFYNQALVIIVTFLFVLKLGGIMHSGGLIFIGFFVVLFTLDIQGRKNVKWLFGVYILTLIMAALLQPYLTLAPEMTPKANLALFVFNLAWVSTFAFLFVLNFISQRVEIEKKESIRLKEWYETKTKLYTNITHEFRTPLTVIRGMADLIRSNPKKWQHEGTRKIENNSDVLLNLVNQMLDLSKLEAGAMPVTKVQGEITLYIRHLIELFQSLANEKNITLQYIPDRDDLLMDYDPDKLMQIISNLVSNALKYTSPGGKVELISMISREKRFLVKVSDNGIGIPEGHLPHIFDRFYKVEDDHKNTTRGPGSGLGLAITQELVKLLDGTIHTESVYGKGTIFTVSLPVTNNAPLTGQAELSEIEGSISAFLPLHNEKSTTLEETGQNDKPLLLIVEDSIDVILYLKALLKPDYRIQVAVNGKEGWKKALDLGPDIILSDIMMPEMDGIELLDKVKNDIRTSHIPLIILTAKADIASRLTGLERGADAYIAKPFNKEELIIQLNRLIKLRKKLQERYAIIGHLKGPQDTNYKIEDSFIQQIREYMLANLGDNMFDIKKLCHEVAMSRTQLYHKFKSLTNKTIFEYLQSLRLLRAKELLMDSDIPVSNAAYQAGFKNLSHFSRAFTKEFGVNPSKIQN